jgi:hypothetical protein
MGYVERELGYAEVVRFEICCHGTFRLRPLPNERARNVSTSDPRHCRRHCVGFRRQLPASRHLSPRVLPIPTAQWPQSCVPASRGPLSRPPPLRSACCRPSRAPPSTARSPSSCDQLSSAPPSPRLRVWPPSTPPSATRFCLRCPRGFMGQPTTPHRCRTPATPMAATTGALRGVCLAYQRGVIEQC